MTIAASLKFSEILAATFSATWLGLGDKGQKQNKTMCNLGPTRWFETGRYTDWYLESFVRSLA